MFNLFREKKKCIFCLSSGVTREHLYSKWLFNLIDISEFTFTPDIIIDVSDIHLGSERHVKKTTISQERKIPYSDFVIKNVCGECNNGWMSKLESVVSSIMEDIIMGEIDSLQDSLKAYELSRWTILKCILLSYTTELDYNYDRILLELLMNGIIPEGFIVELKKMDQASLNYQVGGGGKLFANRIKTEEMILATDSFHVWGLHIGHLGIRVSFLKTAIAVNRVQYGEPLKIIYPFQSRLPLIEHPPDFLEQNKNNSEVGLLCASITLMS